MGNNLTPEEILNEVINYKKSNNLPIDEKVKKLSLAEIALLPSIPSHWKWVTISELSTYITNGVHTPTSKTDDNNYGLHCLRISDLTDNKSIDYEKLPYCLRIVKGDYYKTLKKGDIYFSFTGNILGKRYLVKEDRDDTVFAHYFVRWQPIIVDPSYIYYVSRSKVYDWFLQSHTLGSTQPNLKVTDLKRFPIPLCDLITQQKIASILSNLDEKLEINNKMISNLEESAFVLFNEKCVCKGDSIPMDWKSGCIDDIVQILDSKRVPLSGLDREKMVCKKYPYYGAASLMDYVDDYIFDGIYLLLGEDGTVIDDNGYPILQYVWGKLWVNNHAHVLIGKNGFSTEMLWMLFKRTPIKEYVTGAVQMKLNQQNLKSITVQIPPENIIHEYTKNTEGIFKMIRQLYDENKQLAEVRDTLLPKIMSGEIDVDVIEL